MVEVMVYLPDISFQDCGSHFLSWECWKLIALSLSLTRSLSFFLSFYLFIFVILGFELRACLVGRYLSLEPSPQSFFALRIFQIDIYVQAGLEAIPLFLLPM
jgi:hypothetical protein